MKTEEANMKDFLSATIMGDEIFSIYLKHTMNANLKDKILETKNLFQEQIKDLRLYLENENYSKEVSMKFTQNLTITIESMRVKHKNDLALCLEIINALNKASTNAINFINNNQDKLKSNYVNYLKKIVLDYSEQVSAYINFTINVL